MVVVDDEEKIREDWDENLRSLYPSMRAYKSQNIVSISSNMSTDDVIVSEPSASSSFLEIHRRSNDLHCPMRTLHGIAVMKTSPCISMSAK